MEKERSILDVYSLAWISKFIENIPYSDPDDNERIEFKKALNRHHSVGLPVFQDRHAEVVWEYVLDTLDEITGVSLSLGNAENQMKQLSDANFLLAMSGTEFKNKTEYMTSRRQEILDLMVIAEQENIAPTQAQEDISAIWRQRYGLVLGYIERLDTHQRMGIDLSEEAAQISEIHEKIAEEYKKLDPYPEQREAEEKQPFKIHGVEVDISDIISKSSFRKIKQRPTESCEEVADTARGSYYFFVENNELVFKDNKAEINLGRIGSDQKKEYIRALHVLYACAPEGGFCAYKDLIFKLEKMYPERHRELQDQTKGCRGWFRRSLTDRQRGVPNYIERNDLFYTSNSRGIVFKNKIGPMDD